MHVHKKNVSDNDEMDDKIIQILLNNIFLKKKCKSFYI